MHRFFHLPNEDTQDNVSVFHKDIIPLITQWLSNLEASAFARTCKKIRRHSFRVRHVKFSVMIQELLHAVVNWNREEVKRILDCHPKLLIFSPPESMVITNHQADQKYYAEDALYMAIQLKSIAMIHLLLSYYDKFDQCRNDFVGIKNRAISRWKPYEIQGETGNQKIVIPESYTNLAMGFINKIINETFSNDVPAKHGISENEDLELKMKTAMSYMIDILFPTEAMKLDQMIDGELFILALCRTYIKHFEPLGDELFERKWGLLDTFCIRLCGFIMLDANPISYKYKGHHNIISTMQAQIDAIVDEFATELRLRSGYVSRSIKMKLR